MRAPEDDLSLVTRCKLELPRQHDAFDVLVSRYQDRIYTLCYRLLGNATDAEDCLQEILLQLYLCVKTFDGRSAFSTWLYRVVYNHCLNMLAKRKRLAGRNEEMPEEPLDPRSWPQGRSGRAQAVLSQLGGEDRTILVMKYVSELEIVEIARIFGVSNSAVKMRLLRAREQFKKLYGGKA